MTRLNDLVFAITALAFLAVTLVVILPLVGLWELVQGTPETKVRWVR